jgi:hypothetical protein
LKLALIYTAWSGDDMEMLERSINYHKPHVDEVFVFMQSTSNKGEHKDINLSFPYIFWEPNLAIDTKENERVKHNDMIQHVKKFGFTHFILCACDHFYDGQQFEYAKDFHKVNNIDVSLTFMRTYYKFENWYIHPMEDYCMPFIHRIKPETQITENANYPHLVDPSVMVNTSDKIHTFATNEVLMHHYSMVRKDIEKKFRNAASSIRWTTEQINQFIREYENAKIGDKITYYRNATLCELEF